ncbi:hypothetical protein D9757_003528 [Collybiopsis confluens]|uniref:Bud22 domain-containing protein n=1 Tax=Collybiopsis confluens TaxID=2823264 RepID=A0A8H5MCT4_9AGAR|nr:hypothetical protein D9757_003528 [Collybiopsis confluens]
MKDGLQQRGVKRKRFEAPKTKDLGAKVAGKLHHDLKEVRKAAKKAKTFETQKLVKKLKGLRLNSDPNIAECELQLEELKRISHEAVANTALRSKLTKDKVLSDHETMQSALSKQLADNLLEPVRGGTAAAKIQSRLLSSKILAQEVAAVVEDLRSVVHPFTTDSQDGDVSADLDESMPERPKKLKKLNMKDIPEDEDFEMDLGVDGEEDEDDAASPTMMPMNGNLGLLETMRRNQIMDAPKVSARSGTSQPAASQSTFLPSLSTGFIRGSDSDWSDNDDQAAEIGQRKNRRGQRARRVIWEKKYGKNANHKKKEAALAEADRGRTRWPSGTRSADRPLNKGITQKPPGGELAAHWKPQRVQQPAPVAKQETRPLHPSWEAKKRLSEKQNAAILPPAGRKIKFS